jgi:hypothetical protein
VLAGRPAEQDYQVGNPARSALGHAMYFSQAGRTSLCAAVEKVGPEVMQPQPLQQHMTSLEALGVALECLHVYGAGLDATAAAIECLQALGDVIRSSLRLQERYPNDLGAYLSIAELLTPQTQGFAEKPQ